MDKNLNKYLHSSEGNLEEWEKIALKSLKNSSLEDLSSEYDNGLYRKPLYTKEYLKQDTSYSSARGLREENNTNLSDLKINFLLGRYPIKQTQIHNIGFYNTSFKSLNSSSNR